MLDGSRASAREMLTNPRTATPILLSNDSTTVGEIAGTLRATRQKACHHESCDAADPVKGFPRRQKKGAHALLFEELL
jgi:hypothetical protein